MSDEITQQTLLPGVKDPNLWMVKCRIGEEKNTVLLLMRKFLTYQFTSQYFFLLLLLFVKKKHLIKLFINKFYKQMILYK